MQVLLKRVHRAGLVAGSPANLYFSPTGFAAKCQDQTLFCYFSPAFAFIGVITTMIEANDFRAAQSASIPDQEDGPVSLIPKPKRQRGDHVENVFSQHSFFLAGRSRVPSFDPGKHCRDVAILAVEAKAALLVVPS